MRNGYCRTPTARSVMGDPQEGWLIPSGYDSQFAMENHHAINGKPSVSMGHGFHGELLVITRG